MNRLLTTTYLLIILVTSFGCNNVSDIIIQDDLLTIHLKISGAAEFSLSTKSGEKLNEQTVNNVTILLFQDNILRCKFEDHELAYDSKSGSIMIPLNEDRKKDILNTHQNIFEIYAIANIDSELKYLEEGSTKLQELKELIVHSPDFQSKGGNGSQESFVMVGMSERTIDDENTDLGTIVLERISSKIRLRLVDVDIPGYSQSANAKVRLTNLITKSALIDEMNIVENFGVEELKHTESREMGYSIINGVTTSYPFYTYMHLWEDDTKKPYLELSILLEDNKDNTVKEYKYKVPVVSQDVGNMSEGGVDRLERNKFYDIGVTIKALGSLDVEIPSVGGFDYVCNIKDWTEENVDIEINEGNFLTISERDIKMVNRDNYEITFNSSVPDVSLVPGSLKATYTFVNYQKATPETNDVSYDQMPSIIVDQNRSSGSIVINSPVPSNYHIKDIEFKITNGSNGITETIKVKQLPPVYITTKEYVKKANEYDSMLDPINTYFYIFNTICADDSIVSGFPLLDNLGNIIEDNLDISKMVSPKFMISPHCRNLGTYVISYHSIVVSRYFMEMVSDNKSIEYTDWRFPTEAELRFLDDIQHDPNNPVGQILRGQFYFHSNVSSDALQMKDYALKASTRNAFLCPIHDLRD